MSQAINDWYDRDVDAINEPHRPIPSGRIPGAWGLYIAIIWTALSLAVAGNARPVGLRLGRCRPVPRLGLQRAAAPPQAERLARQCGLWLLLRGAGLGDGSRRDAGRGPAVAADPDTGLPLQPRGPWHHDAERLQVDQGRCADGRQFSAGLARRPASGWRRLRNHGRAADRRDRASSVLGESHSRPESWQHCWRRSLR